MVNITISLTDTENKCMEYACICARLELDNALMNRV